MIILCHLVAEAQAKVEVLASAVEGSVVATAAQGCLGKLCEKAALRSVRDTDTSSAI